MKRDKAEIRYHDIGDYLTREEKLEKIKAFGSLNGITRANGWLPITPDAHGDWLRQRDDSFNDFIVLGDKKGNGPKLFENFSLGVSTNRDAWCYNASRHAQTNLSSKSHFLAIEKMADVSESSCQELFFVLFLLA